MNKAQKDRWTQEGQRDIAIGRLGSGFDIPRALGDGGDACLGWLTHSSPGPILLDSTGFARP